MSNRNQVQYGLDDLEHTIRQLEEIVNKSNTLVSDVRHEFEQLKTLISEIKILELIEDPEDEEDEDVDYADDDDENA